MRRLIASHRQALAVTGLVASAAAAVVLAAGVVDLPGNSGGPLTDALPQETETDAPTEAPTDLGEVDFSVSTYEVFLARDPFEPVVPEPAAGGDGGGGSGTESPTNSPTGSPTTSPTASPTTSPTTSPTASPTPTPSPTSTNGGSGCQQDGAVVCDGHRVSLVDVFEEDGESKAVVRVDDVLYEVETGEVFASSFQVRSVESPCVTLLYGDDAFTLCEGESVLK